MRTIDKAIIHKLMNEAITIDKQCKETCVDFEIMTSKYFKDTLILRWVEIDISDVDRPIQIYRYRCFELDGSPENCSIYYSNIEEANTFFKSLKSYYTQQFAIDHR